MNMRYIDLETAGALLKGLQAMDFTRFRGSEESALKEVLRFCDMLVDHLNEHPDEEVTGTAGIVVRRGYDYVGNTRVPAAKFYVDASLASAVR